MNLYDNVIMRLTIFTTLYIVILIFVSPLIDHLFTSLDEDIIIKESNFQILLEIILHIILLAIVWYVLYLWINLFYLKLLYITVK